MSFFKNKYLPVAALCGLLALPVNSRAQDYPFRDTTLSIERRVDDLISRLTLEEKVKMMKHEAEAVPRLGVGVYNWWNEALHGVARTNEHVTVFPQAIGLAATFDAEGLRRVGDIASTEGRALFNHDMREGCTGRQYRGLTYWTPNINIFRDPRWGRGQETYGEDPYLAAQMGMAMVKGLEGPDPEHLKSVACAKHFAVHSGPEPLRHSFDAHASAYDLWDTYLPAFRDLVTKAGVHGVMCAYNRLEGAPCCGNNHGEASENITLYKELQRRFGERMRVTCLPAIGYVAPLEEGPSMEQVVREAAKRPLIVVNMSGCTMDYAWESQHADALIQAWYGGQATGTALADILFGDNNPSGRLPLTAYKSDADLPDFHDYGMQGRTYRYFTGEPRYPFGYGLSYTTFDYSALSCTPVTQTDGEARVSVTVTNSGRVAGDEVVQLYLTHVPRADRPQPLCALKGFRRVHLQPGESATLTFTLTPDELALTTPRGMTVVQPGEVDIFVGGGQPRYARGITTRMTIEGEPNQVM